MCNILRIIYNQIVYEIYKDIIEISGLEINFNICKTHPV
jgi:hypothetical protein